MGQKCTQTWRYGDMEVWSCGRQLLKWLPVILASSDSREISFPSIWAGPSDSLVTNRIEQKWWHVISKIWLPDDLLSMLLNLSSLLSSHSAEANCHVMSCCMERPRWQGTKPPPTGSLSGIQKNGTEEPICRAGSRDTNVENGFMDTVEGEGESGMNWERSIDIYTLQWIN